VKIDNGTGGSRETSTGKPARVDERGRESINFFAELKRRNVYKVAVAYAIVGWLLVQIATQVFPFLEIPNWVVRLVIALVVIGFPIALVIAWAFEATPEGIKRTEDVDLSAASRNKKHVWIYIVVIGAAISVALFFLGRYTAATKQTGPMNAATKSIAVLPFVDLSQAKDQEYFCDGISEEILDTLAKVEGLRVVARTSSFAFKGKSADVSEIGQKLNVQNVLEGSLRREGNRIRVTAQLINARDGFHIWSDTYERELQSVFAVQDEITRAIVDALKVTLAVAPAARPQQNTEAYDLYLQGLYLSNKTDEESLRKSLVLFQRALDLDPNFGRAWTGIAKAWLWLADAYARPLEAWPKVENAASKALALNETDAEAHCYLGDWKRIIGGDPRAEQVELNRAIELAPNLAIAHMFMAAVHSSECELDEAIKEIQIAEKLDPISPTVIWFAVPVYAAADRFADAVAAGKRLEVNPNYIYFEPPLAEAYRLKGDWPAAAAIYEKAQKQTQSASSGLAVTYAKMGRTDEARKILNELIDKSRRQYVSGETIALIYAALGDREEALRWLKVACDEHSAPFYTFACFPDYRPLHSDPRFADLLRRIGVDPVKALARQKNP
jgi:serine/threonine-protein kinase